MFLGTYPAEQVSGSLFSHSSLVSFPLSPPSTAAPLPCLPPEDEDPHPGAQQREEILGNAPHCQQAFPSNRLFPTAIGKWVSSRGDFCWSRGGHWWFLLVNNMVLCGRLLEGIRNGTKPFLFNAPGSLEGGCSSLTCRGFSSLAQGIPPRSGQLLSLPRHLGLHLQAEQSAGKLLNTGNTSLIVPRPDLGPPAFVPVLGRNTLVLVRLN